MICGAEGRLPSISLAHQSWALCRVIPAARPICSQVVGGSFSRATTTAASRAASLVRVLRIRHLADLGFSLTQISTVLHSSKAAQATSSPTR